MVKGVEQNSGSFETEELRIASQKLFTEAMQVLESYGNTMLAFWIPWKQRVLSGSLQSSDPLTPTVRVSIRSDVNTKHAKQVRLKLDGREGAIFVKRDSQGKDVHVEEEVYGSSPSYTGFFRKAADVDTVGLYRDVIRVIWPPSNRGKGK